MLLILIFYNRVDWITEVQLRDMTTTHIFSICDLKDSWGSLSRHVSPSQHVARHGRVKSTAFEEYYFVS